MSGASEGTAQTWILVVCLTALVAVLTPLVILKSSQEMFIEFVEQHAPSNLDVDRDEVAGEHGVEEARKACAEIPDGFDRSKRLRELERKIAKIEPGEYSDDVLSDSLTIIGYAALKYLC